MLALSSMYSLVNYWMFTLNQCFYPDLSYLGASTHKKTPIKMLLSMSVVMSECKLVFSVKHNGYPFLVAAFLNRPYVLIFQSIICTGMKKWYPDPQHIYCIQSCEVRVQTTKHCCIKYTSMGTYLSSSYQPQSGLFKCH